MLQLVDIEQVVLINLGEGTLDGGVTTCEAALAAISHSRKFKSRILTQFFVQVILDGLLVSRALFKFYQFGKKHFLLRLAFLRICRLFCEVIGHALVDFVRHVGLAQRVNHCVTVLA